MEQIVGFDVARYIHLLNKKKWLILLLVLIVVILTTFSHLRKLTLYQATITTFTSERRGGAFSAAAYLQKLGMDVASGGAGDIEQLISAILYSRRMSKDIVARFGRGPESIETYVVNGVFGIRITAVGPQLAVDIANFCVANVDKLNNELDLSPSKPLLKVLDAPEGASPLPKSLSRNVAFPAICAGILGCALVIGIDYFKKWKDQFKALLHLK